MNTIIANIKNNFYRVLTLEENFTNFSTNNSKLYDPNNALEEDECFKIEKFSEKFFCIDFSKKKFEPAEYESIGENQYTEIEYICTYKKNLYFFQKITPAFFIRKKNFLSFSGEPKINKQRKSIEIKATSDALYDKNSDILYFKDLNKIKSIFIGIEILYREATKEEVEGFLGKEFICLSNGFNESKVKSLNRKRIALLENTIKNIINNPQKKKKLFDSIHLHYPNIEYKDGKFTIESEGNLKFFLYGLDQRFYKTSDGEIRCATTYLKF